MTSREPQFPLEGGCACRKLRYALQVPPIVVHCCHCRWCQRESGASYALHAMIEAKNLKILVGEPLWHEIPSESGIGQKVARCASCMVAVWCVYLSDGDAAMKSRVIKVGTLDKPDSLPPDYQIFTAEKQPWITLSDAVPQFTELYDHADYWPKERLERVQKMFDEMLAPSQP